MSRETSWHLFSDSRFSLHFRYPPVTPHGHTTEIKEYELDHALRIHLVSQQNREVYFEVSRFYQGSVEEAYEKMKASVETNLKALVAPLTETIFKTLTGYETRFQWEEKERAVIFILKGGVLYRLLYDPSSSLNSDILATVEFQ